MTRRGRPRLQASPSGRGTRADLLESAARLFARDGFRASTHAIAEAAGVRQATLYHYFPNREAILLTLLLQTVEPTIAAAQKLATSNAPAPARLWALAHLDAAQLAAGEVNLGALYLLPEIQTPHLEPFRIAWLDLREHYRTLVASCGGDDTACDLALGLVESVILARRRNDGSPSTDPHRVADAVVLVATGRPPTQIQRSLAADLIATLDG